MKKKVILNNNIDPSRTIEFEMEIIFNAHQELIPCGDGENFYYVWEHLLEGRINSRLITTVKVSDDLSIISAVEKMEEYLCRIAFNQVNDKPAFDIKELLRIRKFND